VRRRSTLTAGLALACLVVLASAPGVAAGQGGSGPTYDISTLAGKVASVDGTAGLQIRFSAFIEAEAAVTPYVPPSSSAPITPTNVLSSSLDGTSVLSPDVTVNQDTAGAPQNETAIAVDPNDPNRVVAAANDYSSRTWSCDVNGTPCSALGDGYSGTYYSNNGGATWCCGNTSPSDLGTLIPGVNHLAGGPYDAGGDPALAFDSRGDVYYAGLGFDRTGPPNTVAVNRGTFDGSGHLSWSAPTFINPTTAPSVLNDKEWIAADSNASSPFRDRIYVTWTRFVFNPANGRYVQSPIAFAYSTDHGATFSRPTMISGNVLYGQGSRPVVAPDGTLYVFWDGSTRLAQLDSTYMVKSTDGGASWSKPLAVSALADSNPLADTAFRVNSYPAAAAAPNGDLYVTWTTATHPDSENLAGDARCGPLSSYAGCASVAVWSTSTDGGATWSAPARVFGASTRNAIGYPVTQPDGTTQLAAPSPAGPVEDIFPAVTVASNGSVYISAYRGDVVSPWQTCKTPNTPTSVGRIDCLTLGNYVDNTRLDYVVTKLGSASTTLTTQPINTQYGFGGGFFGDYTDIAAGSDGTYHAFWTDSNNVQTVTWFYGYEFVPTQIHQEDVVTASGN